MLHVALSGKECSFLFHIRTFEQMYLDTLAGMLTLEGIWVGEILSLLSLITQGINPLFVFKTTSVEEIRIWLKTSSSSFYIISLVKVCQFDGWISS